MKEMTKHRATDSLSRRSFVGLAAAAGVASMVAPSLVACNVQPSEEQPEAEGGTKPDETSADDVKRIRTMCRGCAKYECSSWVTVENGVATKIEGDESNFGSAGNCCAKSQASLQAAYHPDRLRYPLKRTNPKGDDDPGWVRISWDEAIQEAGEKFLEIKEKHGQNSLMGVCGTGRLYSIFSGGGAFAMLDTSNVFVAYQVCKGPRHIATEWQSNRAFSWMAVEDRPRVFVSWGGASEISNYDCSCRTTVDAATRADYHIVVDPRLTNLGKEADIWLPLRPGTDGAMALGWLNVIINKNLYNELWVKRWTDLPFLVAQDMEPTEATDTMLVSTGPLRTRLLKESDIVEGGSKYRFMVWDSIGDKLTYFDSETGYWENEEPLNITSCRDLPGKEANQSNLMPGVTQGYVPDMSDFSRCNPVIDPALTGTHEVELLTGQTVTVKPAWEYFVEHVNHYDPETVAEICGVPADQIEKAATVYATPLDPDSGYGNGGIQYCVAEEHSANSIQTCRAIDAIIGLTNNFDTPAGHRGGTIGPMNCGQFGMRYDMFGALMDWGAFSTQLGRENIPLLPHCSWGDAASIMDAANRDESAAYPIYGAFVQSGDFMSMANSLVNFEAMKKLEFTLVVDLWHNPTSQLADIILPAQHWLELDCPRTSQGCGGMEGSICKVIEPLAECRHDVDIDIQLCKVMGVPWNLAGETDEEKWPDVNFDLNTYASAYLPLTEDYPGDTPWEKWTNYFQEQGMQDMKALQPDVWGSYRRYETGVLLQPQSLEEGVPAQFGIPGLATPTRKQEIWCTRIEATHTPEQPFYGQHIPYFSRPDSVDGEWLTETIGPFTLPTYTEPPEGPIAQPDRAKEYPFIMTNGRRIPVYFHTEHRQLPWCRELWPVPRIEMNPADAEEIGVEEGDWVWIETERAKIRQVVDVSYGIRPGTVNCEHQWWLPEFKSASKGFELVGVNCLQNKDLHDPLCGSSYARAYNVKVYKATAENSPFGNPIPCDAEGNEMITSPDDPRLKEWLPVYDEEENNRMYAERNGVQQ